ncbi:MAG TPA: cytochrome P450 [Candidatus Binataceae bacterium]|jgi:cytochrome P450|nr:cytochrome P450 [Candidatus Binataceae bacterium]
MEIPEFDLTNPDCFIEGDPHPYFKYLRQHAPLSRIVSRSGQRYWAVVKYRDALAVYRDPKTFSSEAPISVSDNVAFSQGRGKMLIMTDPPRHLRLRNLFKWSFTPLAVKRWEGIMRTLARRIMAEGAAKGDCDFVPDVAGRLPISVVCQMLGVPECDRLRIEHLGNLSVGSHDPEVQGSAAGATAEMLEETALRVQHEAHQELAQYFSALIGKRRQNPGDDLLSVIANEPLDGDAPMSEEEALYNCVLLLDAGLDTTRNAFSGGVYALLNNRSELERLAANPALVPTAVEEFVRWTSPSFHNVRRVTRDTVLCGQQLQSGELLTVWLGSVNRDEEVFAQADRFDVGRTPNEHMGFGHAQHFCLGANLARLELRIALQELLPYLRGIELTGPVSRLRHTSVPGLKHMPVRLRRP